MKHQKVPARQDPIAHLTGRLRGGNYPPGISLPGQGGKFATDGSVQNWPGNTFVCHVRPDSDSHAALRAMQEEVKMSRFAQFFTFLPPASFHMTVFQGCSPVTTDASLLPFGAEPGMGRDALSARMLDRVAGVAFNPAPCAKMVDLYCCHSVTVTGAGPQGEAPLRAMRQTLREATGVNPPDFDGYVFHITLAYPIDWLTDPTARAVVEFSAELSASYAPELQQIPLGPVEFCNFETMHHFEPLKALV